MAIGAWIRVFFNLRHRGRDVWAVPITAALAIAGVAVWIRPAGEPPATAGGTPTLAQAQAVIRQRCVPCHSAHPTNPSFTTAPAGIRFDTEAEIEQRASTIEQQAVITRAMPLGNATGMTDAERNLLARWIQGRKQ
jgi:uncharacterized membrane protein